MLSMGNNISLYLGEKGTDKGMSADLCRCPLSAILSYLDSRDKASLALAHPIFADVLRVEATSWLVPASSPADLLFLAGVFDKYFYPNLKFLCIRLNFFEPTAICSLSKIPPSCHRLEIQFSAPPTAQSLGSSLGRPGAFAHLTFLELSGGNDHKARLNLRGELGALSSLVKLEFLTLRRLADDKNLEKLTALTALQIRFPWQRFHPPPPGMLHKNPDGLDLRSFESFIDYSKSMAWKEASILGTRIAELPALVHLGLDFAVRPDDKYGANGILNRFYFYLKEDRGISPAADLLIDNSTPTVEDLDTVLVLKDNSTGVDSSDSTTNKGMNLPGTQRWFQNVKTMTILGIGSVEHFLAPHNLPHSQSNTLGHSGPEMWHFLVSRKIFKYMPSLELVKLQVEAEDFPPGTAEHGKELRSTIPESEGVLLGIFSKARNTLFLNVFSWGPGITVELK